MENRKKRILDSKIEKKNVLSTQNHPGRTLRDFSKRI